MVKSDGGMRHGDSVGEVGSCMWSERGCTFEYDVVDIKRTCDVEVDAALLPSLMHATKPAVELKNGQYHLAGRVLSPCAAKMCALLMAARSIK